MKKGSVWFLAVLVFSLTVFVTAPRAQQNASGALAQNVSGILPAPWYIPTEQFSPGANKPVPLGPAIGPNTRMNSLDLCPGGRGIVQSETAIAAFGDVVVAAWNDSRGFFCPGRSTLGWAFSFDGGQTFTDGGTLPGGTSAWSNGDPALAVGPDGTFYVAGISNNFGGMSVSRGTIGKDGITWSNPVRAVFGSGIDKEWLAVDQTTGRLYMAYGRSQRIEVIYSDDQGDTWSSFAVLGSGGIGALPILGPNGEIYVSWLVGWPGPSQRIVVARSDDGGVTFTLPVTVSPICPVTVSGFSRGQMPAFPFMAVDLSGGSTNGRVYITFHSSCSSPGDVYLTSSDDGGQSWSGPVVVNDDGTTAIHFSPSVSVDDTGAVNVTFYDRRENPGTAITNVNFAQSGDGGATFSPNVRVTEVATNWATVRSDITPNMGDFKASMNVGADVLATWSDGRTGDPDAYFVRISSAALLKGANRTQNNQ